MFGNFLHKSAVLSGLGCVICGLIPRQDAVKVMLPLGATSAGAALMYNLLVNGDVLAQYQVDEQGGMFGSLSFLPLFFVCICTCSGVAHARMPRVLFKVARGWSTHTRAHKPALWLQTLYDLLPITNLQTPKVAQS